MYSAVFRVVDFQIRKFSLNIDLNKPWIISNGGELSGLEHLPTKTEYIKYLQIADMHTSRLFGPIKQHYIRFK